MDSIRQLIEQLRRRLRIQRAVAGLVEGACLGLMITGVGIAAVRTGFADPQSWWLWALIAAVSAAVGAGFRALQPIDTIAAARRIDRTHNLHDRLSTAIELAERNEKLSADDEAFVRAQLQDAIRHCSQVDPRRAAPWRRPSDTVLLAVVALAVLSIGVLPMPDHEHPLPEPFEVEHDPVLDDATLAMERRRLEQFRRDIEEMDDPEAEQLADDIEELLDAVENREISEREFNERIDELIADYFGDDTEERELGALERALAEAAEQTSEEQREALEQEEQLRDAIEALEDGDLQAAADELSELAERLDDEDLSAEEAERIADVLDTFSDQLDEHEDRLQEMFEEHRDEFEELADQFDADDSPFDEQLLEDTRQAMEDAARDRDDFQETSAQRDLERLSRELDETADELRDERETPPGGEGEADEDEPDYRQEIGRNVDEASEQLEQMERRRQQQRQREEGRRQLEELEESMSRQSAGDEEQNERRAQQMEDFLDRAGRPDAEDGGEEGEETAELPTGLGDDASEGDDPGDIDSDEMETGDGAGDGGPDDEGRQQEVDEEMEFDYDDQRLEGVEGREGPSRSEVIEGAADDGFATAEYQDVYADYEEIAEEVMDREEVPDGYRYYIKRYFELIRPHTQ